MIFEYILKNKFDIIARNCDLSYNCFPKTINLYLYLFAEFKRPSSRRPVDNSAYWFSHTEDKFLSEYSSTNKTDRYNKIELSHHWFGLDNYVLIA